MKPSTTSSTSNGCSAPLSTWEVLGNATVYSHLWIAAGATTQVVLSFALIDKLDSAALLPYGVFAFCSALSFYSFHRIYSLWKVLPTLDQARWRAVYKRQRLLFCLVVLGGLIALVAFVKLPWPFQWRAAVPTLVSAAYALPIFQRRRLRDWGGAKVLLLATGWVWLCTAVPLASESAFSWWIVAERMAFLVAITLPFDYRDTDHDRKEGVITWPQSLGRQKTRTLAIVLLGFSASLCWYISTILEVAQPVLIGLGLCSLVSIPFIWIGFRQNRPHHLFYGFVLDGLLILPVLSLWL